MPILKAEKREITGKKVQNLRKRGKIPAVVCGAGEKGILLQIPEKDFEKVFRQAGESSLVELEVGAERKNVLIHEVAFDPVEDRPLHVDFLQVRLDKPIRAKVQLVFEGEPLAVKNLGGILVKVAHELEVEALPRDLPHEIRVDISGLQNLGARLAAKDLKLPRGVKIHAPLDEILVLVEAPKSEEELKAEEAQAVPALETIEVVSKKKAEEPPSAEPARPAGGTSEGKEEKKEGKK
ncbi:hypothetical protein A2757_00855 [Candidatus Giovannonibacteria bacterium RIFCSPHIGHO2_01_FULL_48_47]|nr:MAG: hypothetical protein A2757_00855 [Candidatus Giovannonibacteria bacterium RIFCSPHIGHO2_01_FULL_48_47]OGF88514.1 MAG: hypothetical protein A3B26_03150 [Candidatus Giovannonibacteria bacterium RIFCSPLOWO2_01_FULL_48_47]OGF95429.1 MAG: hypothetical protein A2433_00740 [Candidatus Giovannonibacteria bacterium RIFOXYC1_FULL_48_8]OGF95978.1 MAG: hypothetical protein A2613_00175 [Candidatus Giovannonibacteria bacterium RIFOXYD1_FULL_48_21]HBT81397.1 50S ribosomal protein L25 [Candidatus Giovan